MKSKEMFATGSVWRLIAKTSVPAIVTMLVIIVYNMADMFFIGQTGDGMMVAAVSLSGPVMSIFSAFGTLIGSGGCAAIAGELGRTDTEKARAMSSFCCYASLGAGLLLCTLTLLAMNPILRAIGASPATFGYARSYLTVIVLGAPAILFSSTFANIVRAEGAVKASMLGNGLGSVVNILLDPIFILVFGLGVQGAAIATIIGNLTACLYFLHYVKRRTSVLTASPKAFSLKPEISLRVLSLGLPTFIGVVLMSVSRIIKNNVVVQYGDIVLAAMGVAGKVTMVIGMIQMGICNGIQPALAYNYGAGHNGRVGEVLKKTGAISLIVGSGLTLFVVLGKTFLVRLFIDDAQIIAYGGRMAAASVISGPVTGFCYLSTTFLQSTDRPSSATLVSTLRQGLISVPVVFLLNSLAGLDGVIYAQPVADILATAVGLTLCIRRYRAVIRQSAMSSLVEGTDTKKTGHIT